MSENLVIFDSHSHYTDPAFDPDRAARVVQRFKEGGVGVITLNGHIRRTVLLISFYLIYWLLAFARTIMQSLRVGTHSDPPSSPETAPPLSFGHSPNGGTFTKGRLCKIREADVQVDFALDAVDGAVGGVLPHIAIALAP